MRCIVTGGAGFIGSNLVDALIERGDDVVICDDLSTGRLSNLDGALAAGAKLVELDVRDAGAVTAAVAEHRPELVFHLAAQIDVRRSVAEPDFDAAVNVGGTANVLEACRKAETGRVVFISTGGAIYGEGDGKDLPLPETSPAEPLAPYGQSKFAGEGYIALFQRLYGLSGVSLRLGNVYGPRQDPLGEAGVVAIFCGHLVHGGRPTVFGDGTQTRDYIYVGDVVSAALAAGASDAVGSYNVGTGVETSVLELIEQLSALGGEDAKSFEPEFAPARPGEVKRIAIDPSLAKSELGWQAGTDLGEGLRQTLAAAAA